MIDTVVLACLDLAGHEVLCVRASGFGLGDAQAQVARNLQVGVQHLRVVFPDGRLLAQISRANPLATIPTPPSTSSEGIWTLQTHPKHLLRRYDWRPRALRIVLTAGFDSVTREKAPRRLERMVFELLQEWARGQHQIQINFTLRK